VVPKDDELEALRTEVRGFYLMHGNKVTKLFGTGDGDSIHYPTDKGLCNFWP